MGSAAHAIPRLGVPAYNYWNEALHGVARSGYATMFPQAIGMAATWDAPLIHQIGDIISTEARAKNNEALRHGNHDIYYGLTFWSPNINIFRDPRWGRGQETYGEDPFLTGQLAINFVRGMQGDNPRYFKVIATPKHFAVHSGPENIRHKFDVNPTPHDLWDTYLPQFRAAIVDGKADSIMCSYNAVFGEPSCGSKELLVNVLRDDWKFQGFVTSDCGAVDDFFRPNTHRTEPDAEHADRDALAAGTDTNCGSTYEKLGDAVKQGLVKESEIDTSLVRLFTARMKLGLFDPAKDVPYAQIPFSAVHDAANVAVARRTAEESMVLLKNDGILPLSAGKYRTVAVIGPNAAMLDSIEGNYHGTPVDPTLPLDAIVSSLHGSRVLYQPGAPFVDGFLLPVPRTFLHPAPGSAEEGLKAEYFASANISNSPLRTTVDRQINFNWDGVNPLPGHPSTGFAVRWTGTISLPQPGDYRFVVQAGPCNGCAYEQSYKVLIDGQRVAGAERVTETPNAGPVPMNGTTGLPEDAHQQYPQHFTFHAADTRAHSIEIDFSRDSARNGTGISLEFTPPSGSLLPAAVETANKADLIVAMLGLSPTLEGEEMPIDLPGFRGGDRTDVAMPESQRKLLDALAATGKPLVVVLLNGSALAVQTAQEHANAILEAWYPGEAGGRAIADTLTGANDPGGRLPLTFYTSLDELPPFTDYSMKNRTYRYFTGKPLYEFGYGLSYTKFAYSHVKLSETIVHAGDTLTVEADVKNTGGRAGTEVAELYLIPPHDANGGLSPNLQLEGFERVHVDAGAVKHVVFKLTPRELSEVDEKGIRSVQPGSYRLSVGGSQPDDPLASTKPESATFTIVGTQELPH
jgi:beta-glucosidase